MFVGGAAENRAWLVVRRLARTLGHPSDTLAGFTFDTWPVRFDVLPHARENVNAEQYASSPRWYARNKYNLLGRWDRGRAARTQSQPSLSFRLGRGRGTPGTPIWTQSLADKDVTITPVNAGRGAARRGRHLQVSSSGSPYHDQHLNTSR